MDNFIVLKHNVITSNKISDGAFRLYCVLESYAFDQKDFCFPLQKTLAEKLSRSVRTIQIFSLANLIKIKRRGSISSLYTILNKLITESKKKASELIGRIETIIKPKQHTYPITKKHIFSTYNERNYTEDYGGLDVFEKFLLGRAKK
jgi:hypothetical protein